MTKPKLDVYEAINEVRTHQKALRRLSSELEAAGFFEAHSETGRQFVMLDNTLYLITDVLVRRYLDPLPLFPDKKDGPNKGPSEGGL